MNYVELAKKHGADVVNNDIDTYNMYKDDIVFNAVDFDSFCQQLVKLAKEQQNEKQGV